MANELTVSSLGDAVRDKVRAALFSSIPDEAIHKLIENEFKSFSTSQYSNNKSDLQTVILNEIKRQCGERISKSVSTYIDETFVSSPKEMVDAAIKELAPIFMASMMNSFVQSAIQHLRNDLSRSGVNFNY